MNMYLHCDRFHILFTLLRYSSLEAKKKKEPVVIDTANSLLLGLIGCSCFPVYTTYQNKTYKQFIFMFYGNRSPFSILTIEIHLREFNLFSGNNLRACLV